MPKNNDKKTIELNQKAVLIETTPPTKQRYRTLFFLISLVLTTAAFLILTFFVLNTAYFDIDLKMTLALQQISLPILRDFMELISWVGFFPQSILITLLILLVFDSFGFRWEAVLGLITAVFDISLNLLLKTLIHRPRPAADLVNVMNELSTYSFPSGHVMYYVGFFGLIWYLTYTLFKKSWKRTLLLTVLGILIGLVGLSRMFLGQHWFSDVIGGYLMGSLVLVTVIRIYLWRKSKRFFDN